MIENVVLSDSDTLVLEADGRIEVSSVVFCNTSGGSDNLYFNVVKAGSTPVAGNRVISGIAIPANETLVWEFSEHILLENGDRLYGYSDTASSFSVVVNYKERS